MLRWIKQKFNNWARGVMLQKIERLQKENAELKAQIGEETDQSIQHEDEEMQK